MLLNVTLVHVASALFECMLMMKHGMSETGVVCDGYFMLSVLVGFNELACFGVSFNFVPWVDSSVHGNIDAVAEDVYGADCCSNVEWGV